MSVELVPTHNNCLFNVIAMTFVSRCKIDMFPLGVGCILFSIIFCRVVTISDDEYKLLPQMYDMDNYTACNTENNKYCKIKLALMPYDDSNKLWQVIEALKNDNRFFQHNVIYRARCISKDYFANTEKLSAYILDVENKQLKNLSLHVKVENIKCKENVHHLSISDYFVVLFFLSYFSLIIYATVADMLSRKNKNINRGTPKSIAVLSVLNSWEALRKPIRSTNYNRLKSFQGFRVIIMCVVIACHSMAGTIFAYTTNVKLLEDYPLSTFRRTVINYGLHMLQINFMFSGWLHTIQIYNAVNKSEDKKLSLSTVAQALVTRYLRFIIPLMLDISLQWTNLFKMYFSGPQMDLFDVNNHACRTYWWKNLLLINNFLPLKDMCHFPSWYAACDFQAHLVSMVLFYLVYRYNLGIKFFGFILLLIGTVNVSILYDVYKIHGIEIGVTYPVRAEYITLEYFLDNDLAYFFHTSFFTNYSSYLVGILFGAIYYQYGNLKVTVNKITTSIWALVHFGLQALVVVLSFYTYPHLMSSIIGALLKPLFAAGVAIGILGTIYNIGGFMKRVYEWSVLEFMSRWTFSIYIYHMLILFYKTSTWTYMPELSYTFLFQNVFIDIFLAYILGLVLHLVFERPMLHILDMIVTKWKNKAKRS